MKAKRFDNIMPIILIAGAIAVIVLCFFLFSSEDDSSSEIQTLEDKITSLERKIIFLEEQNESSFSQLKEMEATVQAFTEEFKRLQAVPIEVESIKKKIDAIDKRDRRQVSSEKRIKKTRNKPSKKHARKTAIPSKSTKNKKTQAKSASKKKSVRYHKVYEGETLYSIAKHYNLSVDKLLRLNNLSSKSIIHPGQKLAVSR